MPKTTPDLADGPDSPTAPPLAADSRVLVITQVSELGGAERACLALSRWLYGKGIPNHFVTYSDTAGLAQAATHPLTVVQLHPRLRAIPKILALRRYFREHPSQFQPLHSGYQPALHATLGGMRGFHCLMHDTPSLFSDADAERSRRARLQRFISDRITAVGLRSGGRTIVTSTYLRAECRRVFGVDAAIVRMGGFGSLNDFHARPIGGSLRLLSVSRVEANKRIDWMLRTLYRLDTDASLLSSLIDLRLDIVGRGAQLDTMRALAAELGMAARVHFHGFVSDDDLTALYDRADLFLMPAVQGYGIPAIEALQRGIPVLLHRSSGVSDILLDTPWATVFEGDEPNMLAALASAITSAREGRHLAAPLPEMPSEDSWAEQVARLCNWL